MASIIKNNRGLTLAEMLISIAIIGIIGLVLANIIISAYQVVNSQRTYLNLQQESASVLKNISTAAKETISIVNYPEDTPVYYSSPEKLALKVIGLDASGEPLPEIYDYFIYYLEENTHTLKLQIDADPLSLGRQDATLNISNFVDKIIFRYNETDPLLADMITLTLISSDQSGARTKTIKAQTSAYLRNY